MFPMIPATAQRCWWEAECRRWDTDELRRGDGRGHHNMIWERSKVFSARTKVTRESQLRRRRRAWRRYSMGTSMSARRPASSTSWASPAAPTSTTSSSRAAPRRPTTTQRTGSSGSRQTDREWVVGQVDWYDKDRKPSLPRVYYFLTYRWQNTFSSCNRITKLNFYTILRQIYSLNSKDKLFWYVVRTCYVSERKLNSKNSGWFFSKNLFLKCISKQ